MIILLFITLIMLILNPSISSMCVIDSTELWFKTLVPILLPTLILCDLISNNKELNFLSYYLFPLFKILFNIRYTKSVIIIIIAVICGVPASTKLIKSALDNKEIDSKEASSLTLSFSMLSISYTFFILNLFNISIYIFLALYFITATIIMKIFNKGEANRFMIKSDNIKYTNVLLDSIKNAINILLFILGVLISMNVIISLFLPDNLIYPIFEILNGENILYYKIINTRLRSFIAVFSLVFLGLSIHLQIKYVYDIKYSHFVFVKLIQSLFISLFTLI